VENAQKIKDELAPVYGLKNILSAGLVLFGHLTAKKQREIIKLVVQKSQSANAGRQGSEREENIFHRRIIQILREAATIEAEKGASSQAKTAKAQ